MAIFDTPPGSVYGDSGTDIPVGTENSPMIPLALAMLIAGGASAGTSILGNISANRRAREEREAQEEMSRQKVGYEESLQDPFRGQMMQARDLAKLDLILRMQQSNPQMAFGGADNPYAKWIPNFSGGASYEQSPELVEWLQALQRNIAGGNVMPTMTNPANFGRTSALDLVSLLASGQDPALGFQPWRRPAPSRTGPNNPLQPGTDVWGGTRGSNPIPRDTPEQRTAIRRAGY